MEEERVGGGVFGSVEADRPFPFQKSHPRGPVGLIAPSSPEFPILVIAKISPKKFNIIIFANPPFSS